MRLPLGPDCSSPFGPLVQPLQCRVRTRGIPYLLYTWLIVLQSHLLGSSSRLWTNSRWEAFVFIVTLSPGTVMRWLIICRCSSAAEGWHRSSKHDALGGGGENGIMAQVIGGGPSLINNLINLIKAPSLNRFLRKAATEGFFFFCLNGLIHPDERRMHGWHPRRGRRCRKVPGKSIQQFYENLCLLFPNATRRSGGHALVKGCFLIAQLEVAFVKPKFYLYKMAPRLPPKMHGMAWIKTKNAINSPSRRRGETDKIFCLIHTVPNLARINACLSWSSRSFCTLELVWG